MEAIGAIIVQLFTAATSLTPVAIIGLLVGLLYVVLYKQPNKKEFDLLTDNHLHDLPTIARHTEAMVESLRRLEAQQNEKFTEIVTILKTKK